MVNDHLLLVYYAYEDSSLKGVMVNPDGTLTWGDEALLLTSCDRTTPTIRVRDNETESFWMIWEKPTDVRINLFDMNGQSMLDAPDHGVGLDDSGVTYRSLDGDGILILPDNSAYGIWANGNPIDYSFNLYYRRIMPDGSFPGVHQAGPQTLSDAHYAQYVPEICPDGDGGAIVIWKDSRSFGITGHYGFFGQRINDGFVFAPEVTSDLIASEFELSASYPNPFNPSTTFTVTLPASGVLTLSVYNVLGQQVAELADERYLVGKHLFTFDASELASGLYFIHAVTPGEHELVRKVMLVR